jgi:hypothetical protein
MVKDKEDNYRLRIAFDFDDTQTNPVVFMDFRKKIEKPLKMTRH